MNFRVRFRVSIASIILLIIAALTGAMMYNLYKVSSRAERETAGTLFDVVAQGVYERIENQLGGILDLAQLGATQSNLDRVRESGLDSPILPFVFTALSKGPSLYSAYVGLDDGSFFQVIATRGNALVLRPHHAPQETQWIVRTITGSGSERIQRWTYLDAAKKPIGNAVERQPKYDPRTRPWYATVHDDAAKISPPYIFDSLRDPGITASKRFATGVFGVDITLAGLNDYVNKQYVSADGGVAIFDASMRVLAITDDLAPERKFLTPLERTSTHPLVEAVVRAWNSDRITNRLIEVDQDGMPILLHLTEWRKGGQFPVAIAVVAPTGNFSKLIRDMQERVLWWALVCLSLFLAVGVFFAHKMSLGVRALAQDALRIRNLDFSGAKPNPSRIIEFNELGDAFHLMKETLAARTSALEDAREKLTRLVDLGIALSAEQNETRLMEMILLGAKELTNADGATLYFRREDNRMHFQMLRNDTLDRASGSASGGSISMPPVPLFDDEGHPNLKNVVSLAVHRQETVLIADAYDAKGFDFSGTREFDERNHYRSVSFLTVPLKPRGGTVIGALQLINARAPGSEEVVPFPEEVRRFVESLAAQAATALYNRELLSSQDRLMESIIQLIAQAIDAKSPYTGGHCARVPELAIMLAQEAQRASQGPLSAFRFETEKEWREFRIGAWLHDCGKLVTPEYIVDKATKLEAIVNRIHEVRMRYEVLLRDADIARLESVAAGGDPDKAQAVCDAAKSDLLADFAFIAECNVGDKPMTPERIERLKNVAKTTWLRRIDDRLGLSHMELDRFADVPPASLPATETVLADKPWHVVPRTDDHRDIYGGLDFKISVPEDQYNHGEVYNLLIPQGTLTAEDRFKINEHVMQTITMLERLAFPENLERVPEYAGTHHETLVGTGYPRKLDGDQLSIPSRIVAIADIFEALTASDRPYKRAKTLSESVKILASFRDNGYIDPDLFDLFLTSGVYRVYADRFLDPSQIDSVDIQAYVRSA